MAEQTAVEFLLSSLPLGVLSILKSRIKEAKEMEKQQIMDAYDNVAIDDNGNFMTAEQYYNDTFKK